MLKKINLKRQFRNSKPDVIALTIAALLCMSVSRAHANEYSDDYEYFWNQTKDHYAYFDKKTVDWLCVHDMYAPLAAAASNEKSFIGILESSIAELYDPHAILNRNLPNSRRLVPSDLDLWAEWRSNGRAVITQVRPGYAAERAGLQTGMEIVSMNGTPIVKAVVDGRSKCSKRPTAELDGWLLLTTLAGTHDTNRVMTVKTAAGEQTFKLDDLSKKRTDKRLVTTNYFNDRIAYIALHNLSDSDTISQFEKALKLMRTSNGLILDLRDTAAGGNTDVAEPILGRFIKEQKAYQQLVENNQPPVISTVTPRGSWTYDAPVVVLVSRWTGSMGEGMAIGMDAMHRGTVVGTKMAGLNGAGTTYQLANSHIEFTIPTLKTLHMNGKPRELYVPAVVVDLEATKSDSTIDPILNEGINVLTKLMHPAN